MPGKRGRKEAAGANGSASADAMGVDSMNGIAATLDVLGQREKELQQPFAPEEQAMVVRPAVFDQLTSHTTGKKGQANFMLNALEGVIRERGGLLSPTSYYSLLMSTISGDQSSQEAEIDTMLFLLTLLLPEVPSSVLMKQFSALSEVMLGLLKRFYESVPVCRAVCTLLPLPLVLALLSIHPRLSLSAFPVRHSLASRSLSFSLSLYARRFVRLPLMYRPTGHYVALLNTLYSGFSLLREG